MLRDWRRTSAVDPLSVSMEPGAPGSGGGRRIYCNRARVAGSGHGLAVCDDPLEDGAVIGSTRFFKLESCAWPVGQRAAMADLLRMCARSAIRWLARSAIRSAANTEAKLLMLTHAFETWKVLRVCLHTDLRNLRSQVAIARIGGYAGRGVARTPHGCRRDAARFGSVSILFKEWPGVKQRLQRMLL